MTQKPHQQILRTGARLIPFVAVIVAGLGIAQLVFNVPMAEVNAAPKSTDAATTKVDVMKPHPGGLPRMSVQPGSIHAFEAAEIYAKVSGRMHVLNVDIGDRVKEGQILAEIEVPELHRDVDRYKAAVDKANAQVGQMKARIKSSEAEHHAAETGIDRAEANINRDEAYYEFRNKQYRRFQELVKAKSIDERLVDEKEDQRLAAQAALDASNASLAEAKALVVSAAARIEQARADLVDAEAEVDVAKANLSKAEVLAGYTKIPAPYDGVITTRGFHRGDFIRTAEQGGTVPLLTVERTDIVRLVVFMPDDDVPFTDAGDDTVTVIDSLPGHQFSGNVSRIAFSEDKRTKTMRTEVDLKNDKGLLRSGMYGKTTLTLQAGNPQSFTVPSSAIVGGTRKGKGHVFVVREGIARKIPVTIAADNGVVTEISEGLSANDLVAIGNNNAVVDGRPVEAHEVSKVDQAQVSGGTTKK
jgi:RND family efflux transporter MFP subunit